VKNEKKRKEKGQCFYNEFVVLIYYNNKTHM